MNNIIEKSNTYVERLVVFFAYFAGGVLLAMTVLVVVDVIMRYIFNNPVPGGTESTELLLDHIVLVGMAYGLIVGTHVRVTIIFGRLPPLSRRVINILDCVLGIAFFGILTYTAWQFFWDSLIIQEIMMATVKLPYWAGKIAFPIGFLLFAMQFFVLLLRFVGPQGMKYSMITEEAKGV